MHPKPRFYSCETLFVESLSNPPLVPNESLKVCHLYMIIMSHQGFIQRGGAWNILPPS